MLESSKVTGIINRVNRLTLRPAVFGAALLFIGFSIAILTTIASNINACNGLGKDTNKTINVNVNFVDPKILRILNKKQPTHSTYITIEKTVTANHNITITADPPAPEIITIENTVTVEVPKTIVSKETVTIISEPTHVSHILTLPKDPNNLTPLERMAHNPLEKKHYRFPNCNNNQPTPSSDNDPDWDRERHQKKLWKDFVKNMNDKYDPSAYGVVPGTRGIVFSTYKNGIPILIRTVLLLRDLGCELPMELLYINGDVEEEEMKMLDFMGIKAINITERLGNIVFDHDQTHYGATKPFAVLYSTFEQALFLDFENVPVRDPTYLFESDEFKTYGSLFWGDFVIRQPDNRLWWVMELCHEYQPEFESGQILVDKRVAWKGLEVAKHMAIESKYYFQKMLGDKETFHYGYVVTKTPYAMSPYYLSPLGHIVDKHHRKGGALLTKDNTLPKKATFCGQTMLQYDFKGRPLFAHANGVKYSYFPGTSPFSVVQSYIFPEGKLSIDYPDLNHRWQPQSYEQNRCIEAPHRNDLDRRLWSCQHRPKVQANMTPKIVLNTSESNMRKTEGLYLPNLPSVWDCISNISTVMKVIMTSALATAKRISVPRGITIGMIIILANFGFLMFNPNYSPFGHDDADQKSKQPQISIGSDSQEHSNVSSSSPPSPNVAKPSIAAPNLYKRPALYNIPEFIDPNTLEEKFRKASGHVRLSEHNAPFNTHFGFLRQNLTLMRERTQRMPINKVRVAFDYSLRRSFYHLYRHLQMPGNMPFCPRQPECEFYFTSNFDDGDVAMNADALVTDKTKGILVNNASLHFNKYVVLPDQHQSLYSYDWSGTDVYAGHHKLMTQFQDRSMPRSVPLSSVDESDRHLGSAQLIPIKLPIVTFIIPESTCEIDPHWKSPLGTLSTFLNTLVEEAKANWSMPVYIIPPRKCQLPSSIVLPTIPKDLQQAVQAKCPLHEPLPVMPPNNVERNLYRVLPTDDHIRCALAISRGAVVVDLISEANLFSQHVWTAMAYSTCLAFVGDASSFTDTSMGASKGTFPVQSSSYEADPKAVGIEVATKLAEVVMAGVQPGSEAATKQDTWLESVGYPKFPANRTVGNDGDPLPKLMEWKKGPYMLGRFYDEVYNSRFFFPCRVCRQMKIKKSSVRCLLDLFDKHQSSAHDVSMNDDSNASASDKPTGPSGPGPWSDFFDRVYLLHYNRSPERLAHMKNLLRDANVEAHLIRDFDRENVPSELHTCADNWFTTETDLTRNQGGLLNDGVESLVLKHFQAFDRMIQQDLADILVLEDDCEWGEYANTEQVADAFRLIPRNYGIVMLGTLPTQKQGGGQTRIIEGHLASRSTLAYAISKVGVILNFKNFPIRMPIDLTMIDVEASNIDIGGIKHPDWRTFWIHPAIFNHKADFKGGPLL
ncbi:hypothetical protein HDU76_002041 [Blyttiomyces sp. JEL0837]|nr:hypothetical protein HDU76_002041 [Blyttiomyces sp. JEL0837]